MVLLILYNILKNAIDKNLAFTRSDGSPAYPYFKASDFNVDTSDFSFYSGKWLLHGSRYFIGKGPYKGVLIFFHGIGSGRNAYIKPICLFALQGYLVYAFDYTGCMESEGTYLYGMGHVAYDEDAFFEWLDRDPLAQGYERYVVGHSWGGYAALISSNPVYKVKKVISIAGFNRVSEELKSLNPKVDSKLFSFLMGFYFRGRNGKYGDLAGSDMLKKSSCHLLYIQGGDDTMVSPKAGYLSLQKDLNGRSDTQYLIVPHRGHQVFLSIKSEQYINELFDKKLNSPDGPIGLKMNLETSGEENKELLQTMFDFLAN
jgi:Dienelactone hydrolase and related enzymes